MVYAENVLICILLPLIIVALFIKGSARRFIIAFVSGMVICLLSAYIGGFLEGVSHMSTVDVGIFISPITEEIMKFLPVIFYLLTFQPSDENLLLCTAAIGAGFATFENCCYILTSGAQSLSYILIRGSAAGVMHLVSTITLSVGLMLLRRYKVVSFSGIIGALSLAVTFHATYNLLVSGPGIPASIGYCLPLVCALLLHMFSRSPIQKKRAEEAKTISS